ncbi:MAG: hypothetical protein OEO19_08295 [Gammaproteobacteria bacterium]|nr:hypothetical protein [Gammaproteobacteria bacterium]MDH3447393.1 hypothetical protein [Gammaproteobacteria bacterium]
MDHSYFDNHASAQRAGGMPYGVPNHLNLLQRVYTRAVKPVALLDPAALLNAYRSHPRAGFPLHP